MNTMEMKRIFLSHSIVFQCFTQILCTFISNIIRGDVKYIECLHQIRNMNMIEMKSVFVSPCSFAFLQQDIAHLQVRFDWRRGWIQRASIWNKKDEYNGDEESVFVSLCCFVMLRQDIVHLYLRCYLWRGRFYRTSVWNKKDQYIWYSKRECFCFTIFFYHRSFKSIICFSLV